MSSFSSHFHQHSHLRLKSFRLRYSSPPLSALDPVMSCQRLQLKHKYEDDEDGEDADEEEEGPQIQIWDETNILW